MRTASAVHAALDVVRPGGPVRDRRRGPEHASKAPDPGAGDGRAVGARDAGDHGARNFSAGGSINLSVSSPVSTCSIGALSIFNPAATDLFNLPPGALAYARHGYLDFRTDNCGAAQAVTFTFEFPEILPPTAQW
jgi:hypothetical protein